MAADVGVAELLHIRCTSVEAVEAAAGKLELR